MSYLLPVGSAVLTKNKWGLGIYRAPFARNRGLGRWKNYQQGYRPSGSGLGQDALTPCDAPDPNNPGFTVCGAPLTGPAVTGQIPTTMLPAAAALTPPSQPGVNPSIQAAYQNLLTTQQLNPDPLSYVSPQAAIAAGLPAQTVYSAWSSSLARFPSQQAALNAGIPAGVVTQLWAQSRAAAPAAATNTFLGVPITYLLGGGFALLLLAGLRRK
jgi:hypothetical protein